MLLLVSFEIETLRWRRIRPRVSNSRLKSIASWLISNTSLIDSDNLPYTAFFHCLGVPIRLPRPLLHLDFIRRCRSSTRSNQFVLFWIARDVVFHFIIYIYAYQTRPHVERDSVRRKWCRLLLSLCLGLRADPGTSSQNELDFVYFVETHGFVVYVNDAQHASRYECDRLLRDGRGSAFLSAYISVSKSFVYTLKWMMRVRRVQVQLFLQRNTQCKHILPTFGPGFVNDGACLDAHKCRDQQTQTADTIILRLACLCGGACNHDMACYA